MARVVLVPFGCGHGKISDPWIMVTRTMTRFVFRSAFVSILFLLGGCASTTRPLMPTPALYHEPPVEALFGDIPRERRRPRIKLFFATDRLPEENRETKLPYGEKRARSLAFGNAVVEMAPTLTWPELERQSRLAKRSTEVNLEMGPIEELGRFPSEPYAMEVTPTGVRRAGHVVAEHKNSKADFQAELQRHLAQSRNGEVMLYVHGFNETFATAAYTAAELCHFFGREHACAFFTWPAAASGGFLTAYTSTTESAEYAVRHLVKTIRLMAQTPGVKGLQLLAHSRGTAVLLSALRELAIQSIAAGREPVDVFKIDNLVLMSPDIDTDVARQKIEMFGSDPDLITRWTAERLPQVISGRLTIYASPSDRALLASKILFRSRKRVGRLRPEDVPPAARDYFSKWGNIDLIVYEGKTTDRFGHSYFSSNPEVSADLIQLIRYGRAPGEIERALVPRGAAAWEFPKRTASSAERE
jgi:esterase/lipase superfamily enzyme